MFCCMILASLTSVNICLPFFVAVYLPLVYSSLSVFFYGWFDLCCFLFQLFKFSFLFGIDQCIVLQVHLRMIGSPPSRGQVRIRLDRILVVGCVLCHIICRKKSKKKKPCAKSCWNVMNNIHFNSVLNTCIKTANQAYTQKQEFLELGLGRKLFWQ